MRSSNRRAPLATLQAAAALGPPGEALGEAPAGGALPTLDLVTVTAALVAGAEEAELALEEDAMPAWMDGEADTAAESIVFGYLYLRRCEWRGVVSVSCAVAEAG